MTLRQFVLALLLALTTGVVGAADNASGKAPQPAKAATATKMQVIACYFHGTVRCETCLKIERQARETIERRFAAGIADKHLVFMPVNCDKPENAHFLKDYTLPCPSLVLVRQQSGKDEKWKLLDKTWELVENTGKFNEYVEGEVEKLLHEVTQFWLCEPRSSGDCAAAVR
jgi:hypothetical protein